jgi:3-oxoacyl-[acyl-carrier-protein] synthase II
MGEGAGCLVLESLDHALDRKAKIYGEILGVASTSDAKHITNPSTEGDGAYRFYIILLKCFLQQKCLIENYRCMTSAMKNAKLLPTQVTYINTHATSTQGLLKFAFWFQTDFDQNYVFKSR